MRLIEFYSYVKGVSALLLSAREGHDNIVEYLLSEGANPDIMDQVTGSLRLLY
jgi:ankyrin repeat protein